MKSISLLLLVLFSAIARAEEIRNMANLLSDNEKNSLRTFVCASGDQTCDARSLQLALGNRVQGKKFQITSYASSGFILALYPAKIGFQFEDVASIPGHTNLVKFNCDLHVLGNDDVSVTDCKGTQSKDNGSVSLQTFNKVSANNPAQNAIVLKDFASDHSAHSETEAACMQSGNCRQSLEKILQEESDPTPAETTEGQKDGR